MAHVSLQRVKKNRPCWFYQPDLPTAMKGACIMVNTTKCSPQLLAELAFTEEERAQLAKARNMPITYDEDCPPLTPVRAKSFRRANPRKTEQ